MLRSQLRKNLIFLHLPKNGGTTFHSILQRRFRNSSIYSLKIKNNSELGSKDFIRLPESKRRRIQVLKGHMIFGLHEYMYGDSEYVTFLRNPTDRISSFYRYVLSQPTHRLHEKIRKGNMNFTDFLTNVHEWDIHNAQIRCISGIDDTENLMLEKAIENIENYFPVAGTVEKYNESLILLKERYKLGVPFYSFKNVTKGKVVPKKESDPKSLRLIKELNKGDFTLFQYVSNRLEKQLELFGLTNLQSDLNKLNAYNTLYNSQPVSTLKNFVNRIIR